MSRGHLEDYNLLKYGGRFIETSPCYFCLMSSFCSHPGKDFREWRYIFGKYLNSLTITILFLYMETLATIGRS